MAVESYFMKSLWQRMDGVRRERSMANQLHRSWWQVERGGWSEIFSKWMALEVMLCFSDWYSRCPGCKYPHLVDFYSCQWAVSADLWKCSGNATIGPCVEPFEDLYLMKQGALQLGFHLSKCSWSFSNNSIFLLRYPWCTSKLSFVGQNMRAGMMYYYLVLNSPQCHGWNYNKILSAVEITGHKMSSSQLCKWAGHSAEQ
jgi:hypothetical protein